MNGLTFIACLVLLALSSFNGRADSNSVLMPLMGFLGPGLALERCYQSTNGFFACTSIEILGEKDEIKQKTGPAYIFCSKKGIRSEIRLSLAPDITSAQYEKLRQIGLASTIILFDREQNSIFFTFPKLKAYFCVPVPKDWEAQIPGFSGKIHEESLGTFVRDGHTLKKVRFAFNDEEGEAIALQQEDQNNFPVEVTIIAAHGTKRVRFRASDLKLSEPPSQYFSLPVDFVKFSNFESIVAHAQQMRRQ